MIIIMLALGSVLLRKLFTSPVSQSHAIHYLLDMGHMRCRGIFKCCANGSERDERLGLGPSCET